MRLADRERRRLDAEAFDCLENEDGFRLQLLVEFRNRAARSRRLLIDELVRAHLINRKRHQELAQHLGIDQVMSESLVSDQTLGEESYEDSVVDVAPVPQSLHAPISASIMERRTLAHGSQPVRNAQALNFGHRRVGSTSRDEDPSDGDMSSVTMRAKEPSAAHKTALLGAPAQQRLTEPDSRDPELTPNLKDRTPQKRMVLPLLAQIEKLLQTTNKDALSSVRLSIAAQNFARLTHELSSQSTTADVNNRMQKLCVSIMKTLTPEQSQPWLNSFLMSTLSQLDTAPEILGAQSTGGTLSIQGAAMMKKFQIERVTVREGWVTRSAQPVSSSALNDAPPPQFANMRKTYSVPEGWYEVTWKSGERTHRAQSHVTEGAETVLALTKQGIPVPGFVLISSGVALLGAASDSQKHLNFDLYEVPSYELSVEPVSCSDYFEFLHFLSQTQGPQVALRRSPRSAARGKFRWADVDFSKPDQCAQQLGSICENAITGISFHDARAYCHWLNIEKGPGHRLPSEIEWEKAVRGCLGTRWAWGDLWSASLSQVPSPFGIKLSSSLRLEWTSSSGPDARYRISRGIGLENETSIEGLSERLFLPEEQVNQHVGFRVARTSS